MPVEIKKSITIAVDADISWRVPDDRLREIDNGGGTSMFVKLSPREPSFIRMVCAGMFEMPKASANLKMSIVHTDGYTRLVNMRNAVAFFTPADASADLFCDDDVQDGPEVSKAASKRRRVSTSDRLRLKAQPEIIEVAVPGVQGQDAMPTLMLRPVHPCEDLAVALDPLMLEHLIRFIQHSGLSPEILTQKRQYGDEDRPKGVWSNGSGSFVDAKPLAGDGDSPKKYARVSIVDMLRARARPAIADASSPITPGHSLSQD
jgi:hypothetical protein